MEAAAWKLNGDRGYYEKTGARSLLPLMAADFAQGVPKAVFFTCGKCRPMTGGSLVVMLQTAMRTLRKGRAKSL